MKSIKGAIQIVLLLLLSFQSRHVYSQVINNGAEITIQSGAVVYTAASFTNASAGTVVNNGEIITGADLINNAGAALSGNGVYSVQVNFTNDGTYTYNNSVLNFFGTGNSNLKNNGGVIYKLQVNKDSGFLVNLLDNEKVTNAVVFLNNSNWIKLNSKTFTIAQNCAIQNFNNKRFFITNGTGVLKKMNVKNTPFVFPVGFNKSTYNQITITENGTPDDYSVRCKDSALLNGNSGLSISSGGIKAAWIINEAVAGGANAVIEAQWKKPADELPNFDYTKCILVRYAGNHWDYQANKAGTATGTTYRSISRSGLTAFGDFTVLSTASPSFTNAHFEAPEALSIAGANNRQIKIYPTIVQNNFNIEVPSDKLIQKMNIQLIDATGKVVWQKQNADFLSQRISLPSLTSGTYIVLVDYGEARFTQKIIISQ